MVEWTDILKLILNSAMLTLAMVGLILAALMPVSDKWNKRFFVFLFATITFFLTSVLFEFLIYTDSSMATAEKILVFFQYLLLPLPMPFFTAYLLHFCGEERRNSGIFRAVVGVVAAFFVLLTVAQFTTIFYYITPDNQYNRGYCHSLLMGLMILPMIINIIGVIKRRDKLPPKYCAAFLLYLIPLTIGLAIHLNFYFVELVFAGVVFSALAMFAIILFDQLGEYMRQEREIARQRAGIMALQMRPHFIYNAMMSIYYLCAKDSKKAQEVTLNFTTYLRKNFTAIASEDFVPFSDELEHTRAYLAIEKVQFEDALLVEYDTPHTDFSTPPLTLQPIVENAVKYGMDPENTPLHIVIRTRKTNLAGEIIVEDNGAGFSPADTNAPHIALANISERLRMRGGTLTIQNREGGGTIVKATIPQ
ncbi:MAG: histidine kinase [Selenomonadaceae bacterium]|nr:histidine kinase [Selenomonadaceae bacterium]